MAILAVYMALWLPAAWGAKPSLCDQVIREFPSEQMPNQYFSSTMRKTLESRVEVFKSPRFGRGLRARQNLPKRAIVGFVSGPLENDQNHELFEIHGDYSFSVPATTAGEMGEFVNILPMGPTAFFNHAPHPDYFLELPANRPLANVSVGHTNFRLIEGVTRPVVALRTLRKVTKGEELFFEYGITLQSIYFETLWRQKKSTEFKNIYTNYGKIRSFERQKISMVVEGKWAEGQ